MSTQQSGRPLVARLSRRRRPGLSTRCPKTKRGRLKPQLLAKPFQLRLSSRCPQTPQLLAKRSTLRPSPPPRLGGSSRSPLIPQLPAKHSRLRATSRRRRRSRGQKPLRQPQLRATRHRRRRRSRGQKPLRQLVRNRLQRKPLHFQNEQLRVRPPRAGHLVQVDPPTQLQVAPLAPAPAQPPAPPALGRRPPPPARRDRPPPRR
mmetsp:Transcript_89168/g.251665  ORF Transcript_89168/g.251665 Transcript_89168/m.251665 type:complete len:204 (-) Transcript_89168:184-795(-)